MNKNFLFFVSFLFLILVLLPTLNASDLGKVKTSNSYAEIEFLEDITLKDKNENKTSLDFLQAISLENGKIGIDTIQYPEAEGKKAKLTFKGKDYKNPILCHNGLCSKSYAITLEKKSTYSAIVDSFSTWTLLDNTFNGTILGNMTIYSGSMTGLGQSPWAKLSVNFNSSSYPTTTIIRDWSYYAANLSTANYHTSSTESARNAWQNGNGLMFNKNDVNYVNAPGVALSNPSGVTLVAKYNSTDVTSQYKGIVCTKSGNNGICLSVYDTWLRCGGGNVSYNYGETVTGALPGEMNGSIFCAACQWNGTHYQIFVNGAIKGTPFATNDYQTSNTSILIGNLAPSGTSINALTAQIYRAGIFNTSISPTQSADFCNNNLTNRTDLVEEYILNQSTGSTAPDTSGNNRVGNLTNYYRPVWNGVNTMTLDGIDDYMMVPNKNKQTLLGLNNYTMSITFTAARTGKSCSSYYDCEPIWGDSSGSFEIVQGNVSGNDKIWVYFYNTTGLIPVMGFFYNPGVEYTVTLKKNITHLCMYNLTNLVGCQAGETYQGAAGVVQFGKGWTGNPKTFNGSIRIIRVLPQLNETQLNLGQELAGMNDGTRTYNFWSIGQYLSEVYNATEYDPTIWANVWKITATPTAVNFTIQGRAGNCTNITLYPWVMGTVSGNPLINYTFPGLSGMCFQYSLTSSTNTNYNNLIANVNITSNNTKIPTISTPIITPVPPKTNNNITCNATFLLNGTDSGSIFFRWNKNGIQIWNETVGGLTNGTAALSKLYYGNFTSGDYINCTAQANNNGALSSELSSNTVQVWVWATYPICADTMLSTDIPCTMFSTALNCTSYTYSIYSNVSKIENGTLQNVEDNIYIFAFNWSGQGTYLVKFCNGDTKLITIAGDKDNMIAIILFISVLMIMFGAATYYFENELKFFFLLLCGVTALVGLSLIANMSDGMVYQPLLWNIYRVALIVFFFLVLYVVVKIFGELKLRRNAINTQSFSSMNKNK